MNAPRTAPLLRTPRMTFHLLKPDDRAEFLRVHALSWQLFQRYFPIPDSTKTPDELFDERVALASAGAASGTEYRLVARHEDNRIIGFFNLFQIVRFTFQNAIAGWSVSAEFPRAGYGTEGVAALLDFAFAPAPLGLALHRVQANIIPTNVASLRVAEKNGFRREGLAERYLNIAGAWQDHLMHAKTAEEHQLRYL